MFCSNSPCSPPLLGCVLVRVFGVGIWVWSGVVSGSGWAAVSEYLPLLSHLPCHCVAWSVQRQCQFPTSLLHTPLHTLSHTIIHSTNLHLSQFLCVVQTVLPTPSHWSPLHSCFPTVKSNLSTCKVQRQLCCVVLCATLTLSRLLSHDQLPQRALNRYNHNPSFHLCCVCVCVVTTAFPLPRLSTWKVQRQFQLV